MLKAAGWFKFIWPFLLSLGSQVLTYDCEKPAG